MDTLEKPRDLSIIILQPNRNTLDSIRDLAEIHRRDFKISYTPNVFYTSNVLDVFDKIKDSPVDIVVSDHQLYSFKDLERLSGVSSYDSLNELNSAELKSRIIAIDLEGRFNCANILAAELKKTNPDIWVFRYNHDIPKDTSNITGDIDMGSVGTNVFVEFLNSPMLPAYYFNKDFASLKDRFPFIKIYEKKRFKSLGYTVIAS